MRPLGTTFQCGILNPAHAALHVGRPRSECVCPLHRAEHIQAQNVRRSFPDREHLRVPEKPRESRVLDITRAAECFERFTGHRDCLLRGVELRNRNQESQKL